MDEFKLENDSRESVVGSQMEGGENSAGESAAPEGEGTGVASGEGKKPQQSHEDNQAAKSARLQAQRETEERMNAAFDRSIARAGIVNPYTQKTIKNQKELNEYFDKLRTDRLEEEAKRTGKSVEVIEEEEQNREYISTLRKNASMQETKRAGFDLAEDAKAFMQEYPDVSPIDLEQNESFRKFAGSRLYNEPLAGLYGDFLELTGNAGKAAVAKAQSKADRSTGAGNDGGTVKLTAAQQTDLEAWNRMYPNMKMTAKEFVGR